MKKYIGMNFGEWCQLDINDDRKINYTLKGFWDRKEQEVHFTSDDEVEGIFLHRLQNSTIENIKLVNNEWFVTVVY